MSDKIDVAQFLPFNDVDNIVDEDVESDIVAQEMVALRRLALVTAKT